MYKIFSDGGCDFTNEEIEEYGIGVVPFYITFDGAAYLKEGEDITKDEFFNRLVSEKNLYPKTSQPNPQDYIEALTPHLKAGYDIILLTISSKLSGSYASAAVAADILKDEYTNSSIIIIDSLSVSVGQNLILKEIIKMQSAGYSLKKTARLAKEVRATTNVYFTLDSLEYLKKGGRIGPTTAFVGNILGLRPILQLEDGQVTQLDNVRGKARAIKLMEEAIADALYDEKHNVSINVGHILSPDDAVSLKTGTEAALGIKIANPIIRIGASIGVNFCSGI